MIPKIPPHSIEAEQGVLGSILLDKDGIIQISSLVAPEDFYDGKNAVIYEVMLDLFLKNRPIDLLTVREHLDDRKKLEEVGGNQYLVALTNSIFTSSNIYQYGQIVKTKSVLRKLIKAGSDILMY
jgi:replicative DNA helicase